MRRKPRNWKRPGRKLPWRAIALALTCAGLGALAAPPIQYANTIVIVSGDGQSGAPGTTLGAPFVVNVTDGVNPVAGAPVTFVAAPGTGGFLVPDLTDGIIDSEPFGALVEPVDVATDAAADVYAVDRGAGTIIKLDVGPNTTSIVTGGGGVPYTVDGVAASSIGFLVPRSIEFGKGSDDLIFVDEASNSVYRINGGNIFLVAGGLLMPVDATENYQAEVFVALGDNTIIKVGAGVVATLGAAIENIEMHPDGQTLLVAAADGVHRLGIGVDSTDAATGVTADRFGELFYASGHQVKHSAPLQVVAGTGQQAFSGDGECAIACEMNGPRGLDDDVDDNTHVADTGNDAIRKVTWAKKEVPSITVYTDRFGVARSRPFKVGSVVGPQSLTVTSPGAAAVFFAYSATFTTDIVPNVPEDAADRPVSDVPALLNPRWTPPAAYEFKETPPALPPPAPPEPMGGSHQRLTVDRQNIVHVAWPHTFDDPGVPDDPQGIVYTNNRWESRRASGFAKPKLISDPATFTLAVGESAIAAGPGDSVHVAWFDRNTEDPDHVVERIMYRRLVQEPGATLGWSIKKEVLNGQGIFSGGEGTQELLGFPHIDVDAMGVTHIGMTRKTRVIAASPFSKTVTWEVLELTVPADINDSIPPAVVRRKLKIQQTGAGTVVLEAVGPSTTAPHTLPFESGQPADVNTRLDTSTSPAVHFSWLESDGEIEFEFPSLVSSGVSRITHLKSTDAPGAVGSFAFTQVGVPPFDMAVGSDALPQFAYYEIVTTDPFKVELRYRKDVGGTSETILVATDGLADFTTRPLIDVDSRDRPHVVATGAGLGPVYARRSLASGLWECQKPIRNSGSPDRFDWSRANFVQGIAFNANDVLHVAGAECCFRQFEPNLGEQDGFLMFDVGPNLSANSANGNVTGSFGCFSSRGVGFATSLSLVYNSREPDRAALSPGWQTNYHLTITDGCFGGEFGNHDLLTLQLGDGRSVTFRRVYASFGGFEPAGPPFFAPDAEYGYFSKIEALKSAPSPSTGLGGDVASPFDAVVNYRMTTKFGVRYVFNADGKLVGIFDTQAAPNTMTFNYGPIVAVAGVADSGVSTITNLASDVEESVLTSIVDSTGTRTTSFAYASRNRLVEVKDPDTKKYKLTYDASGRLGALEMPLSVTWSFAHGLKNEAASTATVMEGEPPHGFERIGLLREVRTPRGTAAPASAGWFWRLYYYPNNYSAGSFDPKETHATEDESEAGSNPPDETLAVSRILTYDETLSVATFHNRRNKPTHVAFEPRRCLATAVEDAFGNTIEREFFPGFRNLQKFTDKGSKKEAGVSKNSTSYTYFDSDPVVKDNLATITRPGVPAIEYTYTTSLNRVQTVKDSRGFTTTYEYDGGAISAGNLTKITYPPAGGERNVVDPITAVHTSTPVSGAAFETFAYDSKGRVTGHTNPNTGSTLFSYLDFETGLVTSIKRPVHANPEFFDYDPMGNTLTHTLPEGGVTTFVLDALYRVKEQHEPPGDVADPTTFFDYDLDSNVVKTIDPRTQPTEHAYDKLGRLKTTTNAQLKTMDYVYDPEGNTRAVKDFRGFVSVATFDKLNRTDVSKQPGPPAMKSQTVYDPNGNVDKVMEFGEVVRTTEHFYDDRNNNVKTQHPLGALSDAREFDENDNMTSSVRNDGAVFSSGSGSILDSRNRVVSSVALTAAPLPGPVFTGDATLFAYDHASNRSKVTGPDGRVTRFATDLADRQNGVIDGAGVVVSLTHFNDNDLATDSFVPSPAGVVGGGPGGMLLTVHRDYNARNELKVTTDALGQFTTNEYDAGGLLIRTFDQDLGKTEYDYDELGRMTHMRQHVNAGGLGVLETVYTFDENGNRDSITDPRGKLYAFAFDDSNRMKSMTTPLGFTETWTYTDHGEMKTHTDANGKVAVMCYDELGRLHSEVHTLGGAVFAAIHRTYTASSSLKSIVDTKTGLRIFNTYTVKQELETTSWFTGATTESATGTLFRSMAYTYHANGQRATLAFEGDVTGYFYDANNRLEEIKKNGALIVKNVYDAAGRRTQVRLHDAGTLTSTVDYTYTAREELDTLIAKNALGGDLVNFNRDYDDRGNVISQSAAHVAASASFGYLPVVNWLTSETWTGTTTYAGAQTYDENGNRKTHDKNPVPGGVGAEHCVYTVDDDNRLLHLDCENSVTTPGGTVQVPGTPIVSSTKPGHSSSVLNDGVTTDSPSAPLAWRNKDTTDATPWAGLQFASATSTNELRVFIPTGPDSTYSVQQFKVQALISGVWTDVPSTIIGAVANVTPAGTFRTTSPMVHEMIASYAPVTSTALRVFCSLGSPARPKTLQLNEIKAFSQSSGGTTITHSTVDYGFDANGNQVSRAMALEGIDQTLETYAYDHANWQNSYLRQNVLTATTEAHFTYLAMPTRQRFLKTNVQTMSTEAYMYDGADVAADYDGAGVKTSSYLQSTSVDTKWVRYDATNAAHFYLPDGLGSVVRVINAAGVVENTQLTTAWGEDLVFAQALSDRHGFTQREKNSESDTYYYRARMYDPRIARLGQKDPRHRVLRPYVYVENAPVGVIDPYGLQDVPSPASQDDERLKVLEAREKELRSAYFWGRIIHRPLFADKPTVGPEERDGLEDQYVRIVIEQGVRKFFNERQNTVWGRAMGLDTFKTTLLDALHTIEYVAVSPGHWVFFSEDAPAAFFDPSDMSIHFRYDATSSVVWTIHELTHAAIHKVLKAEKGVMTLAMNERIAYQASNIGLGLLALTLDNIGFEISPTMQPRADDYESAARSWARLPEEIKGEQQRLGDKVPITDAGRTFKMGAPSIGEEDWLKEKLGLETRVSKLKATLQADENWKRVVGE